MPSSPQKSAVTVDVGGRPFVVHLYSSSLALEVLLALGEAAAPALGRLLDREVSSDLSDLAQALEDVREREFGLPAMLSLFSSVRKSGGVDLVVQVLQTTWHEDRPINTRSRFDEVFQGPGALADAARLLWEVLRFQLRPLWGAVQPLLSGLGGAAGQTRPS